MIPGVIKELDDKGLTEMSEGAKCIFLPDDPKKKKKKNKKKKKGKN